MNSEQSCPALKRVPFDLWELETKPIEGISLITPNSSDLLTHHVNILIDRKSVV